MAAYSGTATVSHTFWACRRCFSTLFPAFTRGRGARYTLARFEGLAPQEQARHLASADILLAPHGSALGWMPLLPHGAVALIAWGSGADYIKPGEVDYPCLGTWMGDVHVRLLGLKKGKFTTFGLRFAAPRHVKASETACMQWQGR